MNLGAQISPEPKCSEPSAANGDWSPSNFASVFSNEQICELIDDPRGFTVNFFRTLADAENNENALPEIGYTNEVNGQVVYVRVFVQPKL